MMLDMLHKGAQYFSIFTIPFLIKLCVALAIIIMTRMIIKSISPLVHDACQRNNLDHHTCHIITKIVRYVLTTIGFTIAFQNLGIEVSMLIAAFGITGIVLSYGMKDIVANFIASVLILGYKNIKINDYIKIKDWEGKVIDINLRYTTLQNDQTIIFVPNIWLYTQPVAIIKQ